MADRPDRQCLGDGPFATWLLVVFVALTAPASTVGAGDDVSDAFSFVFIPDTQNRCRPGSASNAIGCAMWQTDIDWLIAQARGELDPRLPAIPLAFVASGGDLTSPGNEVGGLAPSECQPFGGDCEAALDYSWAQIAGGWTRLAQEVCAFPVPGDHDLESGLSTQRKDHDRNAQPVESDPAGFERYLAEAGPDWAATSTARCAAFFDDSGEPRLNDGPNGPGTGIYGTGLGLNRVAYVRAGAIGQTIRVVGVNLDASPTEMAWHAERLAEAPGVPTIVTSHAIVGKTGVRGGPQGGLTELPFAQGARDWLTTFDPHPEVWLALGGHYQSGPIQTRCTDAGCNSPRPGGTTWDQWTHNFQSMDWGGRYLVYFAAFPSQQTYCWWTIAPSHDFPGREIDFVRSVSDDPDAMGCRPLDWGPGPPDTEVPGPGGALALPLGVAGAWLARRAFRRRLRPA